MNLNKIFDLSEKVIVVTGGCGLLGRQHCEAIAESGGIPVILDLDGRRAEKLGEEISNTFLVDAAGYKVDISKEEQVAENSIELIRRYGKIDCLVNNAANNSHITKKEKRNFSRLENFSFNEWEADIAVGLTGAFLCSKYYGFRISENPEGGVILNISSDLGLLAPDQRLYREKTLSEDEQPTKPVSYSVVKSGLIGLTKYLSTYWPHKVRCNALCPGGVENEQSQEFLSRIKDRIPMGRMAATDEYQGAIIFLLSRASEYMNGETLLIDGGRSAW